MKREHSAEKDAACECVGYTIRTDYGTGIEHDVDRSSCPVHGAAPACSNCDGEDIIVDPISQEREAYTCPDCGGSGKARDQIERPGAEVREHAHAWVTDGPRLLCVTCRLKRPIPPGSGVTS